jgi:ribosomal protein S18 acetylase RimI-like enzyme
VIEIRAYETKDWSALWPILEATVAGGDSYAFSPNSSEADLHKVWIETPSVVFVALDSSEKLVGSYFIKPNQPGLGSHVCNCGYVVAAEARGLGVATEMCEHSQAEAIAMGFRAMQFNFVVETNERAVKLWQKLGFAIVGRLPRAFKHSRLGYVDALVMFKTLVE